MDASGAGVLLPRKTTRRSRGLSPRPWRASEDRPLLGRGRAELGGRRNSGRRGAGHLRHDWAVRFRESPRRSGGAAGLLRCRVAELRQRAQHRRVQPHERWGGLCPRAGHPGLLTLYDDIPSGLPHVLLWDPAPWQDRLPTLELTEKTVAWLWAVPISESELAYLDAHGPEALADALEEANADVADLERSPVMWPPEQRSTPQRPTWTSPAWQARARAARGPDRADAAADAKGRT
ncbi:MAG: suppressor of fused domain protein [Planctomycetota bacterium]